MYNHSDSNLKDGLKHIFFFSFRIRRSKMHFDREFCDKKCVHFIEPFFDKRKNKKTFHIFSFFCLVKDLRIRKSIVTGIFLRKTLYRFLYIVTEVFQSENVNVFLVFMNWSVESSKL